MALSQKDKLLNLLKRNRKGITVRKARAVGVNEPRKRVYDLRVEGYSIRTDQSGDNTVYRLV